MTTRAYDRFQPPAWSDGRGERPLSLQMTILKVLSGHPNGRATLAAMNADIAILIASGREWSARMKRLDARAPALDIFGQGLVIRDNAGWQITATGRVFLQTIEADCDATGSLPPTATLKRIEQTPAISFLALRFEPPRRHTGTGDGPHNGLFVRPIFNTFGIEHHDDGLNSQDDPELEILVFFEVGDIGVDFCENVKS